MASFSIRSRGSSMMHHILVMHRNASSLAGQEKALTLVRHLPSINLKNISHPGSKTNSKRGRGRYGGDTHGCGDKGAKARQRFTPAGFQNHGLPFFLKVPVENPYKGHHIRRQYLPISLHQIQLMVDTDRLDPDLPIDLCQICRTGLFRVDPVMREFGFQLIDEGMDYFKAKVHLEVQYATEHVIAAVERAGGSITTAYYDACSVQALQSPLNFFKSGRPIPRRALPPQDCVAYYTDPAARGYLADPSLVAADRLALSQKYGYQLSEEQLHGDSSPRKDARQIFFGLEPGWLINLADKQVYKAKDEEFNQYCAS